MSGRDVAWGDPRRTQSSRVTFETRWRRNGLAGWVERWLAPPYLRGVYRAELALLDREARARVPHHDPDV